jgi:hypothetical protein
VSEGHQDAPFAITRRDGKLRVRGSRELRRLNIGYDPNRKFRVDVEGEVPVIDCTQ